MESQRSHHILTRLTKIRRRPQQPLTDFTELYSRIANETIYYLNLEEKKRYKEALQGWKALTTDVLFKQTLIEHNYPNTQSYTKDEVSLQNGIRELYHKSVMHLERVKKLVREEPAPRNDMPSSKTYTNHSSSFTRSTEPPPVFQMVPGRMMKTLRNRNACGYKTAYSNPSLSSYGNSTSIKRGEDAENIRVNFVPSKPLSNNASRQHKNPIEHNDPALKKETELYSDKYISEPILIDLTNDEDDHDVGILKGHNVFDEEESDGFEFDVSDYYDNFSEVDVEEEEEEKEERRRIKTLEAIQQQMSDLSVTSSTSSNKSVSSSENVPGSCIQSLPTTAPALPSLPPPPLLNVDRASSTGALKPHGLETSTTMDSSKIRNPQISKLMKNNHVPYLKGTKSTPTLITKSTPTFITRSKSNTKPIIKSNASSPTSSLTVPNSVIQKPKTAAMAAKRVLNSKKVASNPALNTTKKSHPILKSKTAKVPNSSSKKTSSHPSRPVSNSKPYSHGASQNKKPSKNQTTSMSKTNRKIPAQKKIGSPKIEDVGTEDATEHATSLNEQREEPEIDKKVLREILEDEIIDSLQGVDRQAAKQIFAEIVVHGDEVHWDDIAGLESAKYSLKEAVVYPFLRPDLFRGLREPVRGMLLFGPPGTGKTMLARAVATESHSTFFSISASSLTSKYLGESEKLVRALFAIAKKLSPSIIFVDEIDSIMGSRNNENENESSRRIKNEFLVQWSSLSSAAAGSNKSNTNNSDTNGDEDDTRVLVLAATNLPWSIDEAARRRFVRRQYIPLPEDQTRHVQFKKLLSHQKHTLTESDFDELVKITEGYSGSDITSLAKDAAMGPLRDLGDKLLETEREMIRPIGLVDFKNSLEYIKPSVSQDGLVKYEKWASQFGSSGS
ncbi:BMC_2a_G0015140.mRNA.1.CDS.1 [Saccharomyces cerevisiae]|nr:Sap1p [Saccharomyces cerevisiae YJM1447]CAI4416331.1 BMC_2a_G0015140.mRNA.1.CDS.1 [Saccharomyces cerevisiae]CAI4422871.1 BMB_G0015140.mRNA.1.CDS.1 [Saccharomyces cerevisiae]CAI7100466.1 BMC_2a_G0015140.mRNA.1.CDS.1 [Saccharomyces cerevisiae]CAI7101925.1 BMB_G0015140.mRNA.1.CDS.1 [Saccharomyces cerevisiae]